MLLYAVHKGLRALLMYPTPAFQRFPPTAPPPPPVPPFPSWVDQVPLTSHNLPGNLLIYLAPDYADLFTERQLTRPVA